VASQTIDLLRGEISCFSWEGCLLSTPQESSCW